VVLMLAQCAHDWQAVADVWGFFENQGMSPELLAAEDPPPRLPLAVLGCGRGGVLAYLQQRFGATGIHGLDASPRMVEAARERGCANVRLVSPDAGDLGLSALATIIVSTGVLDPLELNEGLALFAGLRRQIGDGGSVWVYAFGRFGPNWTVAEVLRATDPLGIANHRLFDLYERAEKTSLDRALSELDIPGSGRLAAKAWLFSMRRFLEGVIRARGHDQREALEFLRSVSPSVQRRFATADVCAQMKSAGFRVESVREHERAGVMRIIGSAAPSRSAASESPCS
jgi:SAM-dependent methyltransferase